MNAYYSKATTFEKQHSMERKLLLSEEDLLCRFSAKKLNMLVASRKKIYHSATK